MPNPSTAEKLASQLGRIYVATVMPLVTGGAVPKSMLAHVAGYYAGITYQAAATGVVAAAAEYVIVFGRQRGRR